jgi:hypothetical protein
VRIGAAVSVSLFPPIGEHAAHKASNGMSLVMAEPFYEIYYVQLNIGTHETTAGSFSVTEYRHGNYFLGKPCSYYRVCLNGCRPSAAAFINDASVDAIGVLEIEGATRCSSFAIYTPFQRLAHGWTAHLMRGQRTSK